MFTGGVHWQFGSVAASVLENYLQEAPPEGIPPMPAALAELLRQCFQDDPEQRPASMDEVAERLMRLYEQETGAPYPRQKPKTVSLVVSDLNNRALSYLDLGKKDKTEELLKEAVEKDPAHPEAVYNLALLEWWSGRIDDFEVVRRLEELCKSHLGEWLPVCLLANIHLDRGDNETAIHILETVKYYNADLQNLLSLARKSTGSRCLRSFEGHKDIVNSIFFSPDGRYVLSGSNDKTLKLWNVITAECLRTFEGHEGRVNSVCCSPDGRYVLSGSDDETIKLWDVATGQHIRTFKGHKGEVKIVCFSPDGSKVLSGSRDGTLKLWNMRTGVCLKTLEKHEGGVVSACFNPNGKYILSGGGDKKLKIWDIGTGEHIITFGQHSDIVLSVCFSPDGNYALSASGGDTEELFDVVPGELLLWDVLTGRLIKEFKGHGDVVSSACFSPNGRFVLSGSYDKTTKLWDLETGRCIRTFEGHGAWVSAVCFSPDGMYALSGSYDHNLYLWSLERIPATLRLAEPISSESAISSHRNFKGLLDEAIITTDPLKRLECLSKARAIQGFERAEQGLSLWLKLYVHFPRIELRASWELRSFHGHKDYVNSVCFNPDGNYALSGSKDETLRLWDVRTGECLRTLKGHKWPVNSVCFSPEGRYLLSGSYNEPPKLWDIKTGECLRNFEEHVGDVRSVCFSPDGRYAISAGSDFRLWRVETGESLLTFKGHEGHVNSVCFSPDGRYILSGGAGGILKIWNTITGKCLRTFEGHEHEINSVQFSPDGKYVLSGSTDRTLKIWDVKSAKCIKTIKGHAWQVQSCFFSPDGKYVISGSLDKTIKLWDVLTGECLWTFVGHEWGVTSVCFSPDASYILSGSADNILKLWILDWDLEEKDPADWDEGARPYLDIFLTLHTPYGPDGLRRVGKPQWTEEDFQKLLQELGYRGYGWLRPAGVRRELEKMAKERS
jgi:WD40 repeat protein